MHSGTTQKLTLLAVQLGSHPWEILALLVLLVVVLVFLAPRLVGALFRWLRPWLHRLGTRVMTLPLGSAVKARLPWMFDEEYQDREARAFLALYLVLGLLALIGSLALFAEIALSLVSDPTVQAFDEALARSLRNHATPGEVLFFSTITHLSGVAANQIFAVGVAALLIYRREKALLQLWLIAILGSGALIGGLKSIFQRPRPVLENPFAVEASYSFPSGHSMSSVVLYGMLAYILILTVPKVAARLLIFATIIVGVGVGMSRMVLGVHYLSDVVAGWSIGLAWLSLLLSGAEYWRRRALLRAGMSDLTAATPPEED